jgi:hypothetical protein
MEPPPVEEQKEQPFTEPTLCKLSPVMPGHTVAVYIGANTQHTWLKEVPHTCVTNARIGTGYTLQVCFEWTYLMWMLDSTLFPWLQHEATSKVVELWKTVVAITPAEHDIHAPSNGMLYWMLTQGTRCEVVDIFEMMLVSIQERHHVEGRYAHDREIVLISHTQHHINTLTVRALLELSGTLFGTAQWHSAIQGFRQHRISGDTIVTQFAAVLYATSVYICADPAAFVTRVRVNRPPPVLLQPMTMFQIPIDQPPEMLIDMIRRHLRELFKILFDYRALCLTCSTRLQTSVRNQLRTLSDLQRSQGTVVSSNVLRNHPHPYCQNHTPSGGTYTFNGTALMFQLHPWISSILNNFSTVRRIVLQQSEEHTLENTEVLNMFNGLIVVSERMIARGR